VVKASTVKIIINVLCLLGLALVSACGGFAGPYGYAEKVSSTCPRDTLINRLIRLKAAGRYNHPYSFPDGPATYPSYYRFYFFSRQYNCILFSVVRSGFNTDSAILLIGV
jgi:hypothetical protein